jgi:hypothetical protein
MSIFKHIDQFSFPKKRRKNIIIEDSFFKCLNFFDKNSLILNPRNPTLKDEAIIDYDMSSEEEWNELNGEDLNDNKNEEIEED